MTAADLAARLRHAASTTIWHEGSAETQLKALCLQAADALDRSASPSPEPLLDEIALVLKQVEMTSHRADALPPNDTAKPTATEWRERAKWLCDVLVKSRAEMARLTSDLAPEGWEPARTLDGVPTTYWKNGREELITEARTGPPAKQAPATGPYISPDGSVPTVAGFAGLPEHLQPSNLPRVNRADEPEQEEPRAASAQHEKSAGDLYLAALDEWFTHCLACDAETCDTCAVVLNQARLARKVWQSSTYKAVGSERPRTGRDAVSSGDSRQQAHDQHVAELEAQVGALTAALQQEQERCAQILREAINAKIDDSTAQELKIQPDTDLRAYWQGKREGYRVVLTVLNQLFAAALHAPEPTTPEGGD